MNNTYCTEIILLLREVQCVTGKLFPVLEYIVNHSYIREHFSGFKETSRTIFDSIFERLDELVKALEDLHSGVLVRPSVKNLGISAMNALESDHELYTFYQRETLHLTLDNKNTTYCSRRAQVLLTLIELQKEAKIAEYSIVHPIETTHHTHFTYGQRLILPKTYPSGCMQANPRHIGNQCNALKAFMISGKKNLATLQACLSRYIDDLNFVLPISSQDVSIIKAQYLRLIQMHVDSEESVPPAPENLSSSLSEEDKASWRALTQGFKK